MAKKNLENRTELIRKSREGFYARVYNQNGLAFPVKVSNLSIIIDKYSKKR